MYDLEKDVSLNAYRFVLWGKAIVDQQQTTLFTRDGQQWLLEFDRLQRQFRMHLIERYDSAERGRMDMEVLSICGCTRDLFRRVDETC